MLLSTATDTDVPVGIQNAAAASEKTKDPSLHKGNTASQTLD